LKRNRNPRDSRQSRTDRPRVPLQNGQRLRDRRADRTGQILDHACQYAHPKAEPVFSYLIRWEDGQIQAFTEAALDGSHGIELLD
jgi:hypothetical protein